MQNTGLKQYIGKGFFPLNNTEVVIRDSLVIIGCHEVKSVGMGGMPTNSQGTLNKHHNM